MAKWPRYDRNYYANYTYYPFFAEPIPNPEVEKPTKEKPKKIALEASWFKKKTKFLFSFNFFLFVIFQKMNFLLEKETFY